MNKRNPIANYSLQYAKNYLTSYFYLKKKSLKNCKVLTLLSLIIISHKTMKFLMVKFVRTRDKITAYSQQKNYHLNF